MCLDVFVCAHVHLQIDFCCWFTITTLFFVILFGFKEYIALPDRFSWSFIFTRYISSFFYLFLKEYTGRLDRCSWSSGLLSHAWRSVRGWVRGVEGGDTDKESKRKLHRHNIYTHIHTYRYISISLSLYIYIYIIWYIYIYIYIYINIILCIYIYIYI